MFSIGFDSYSVFGWRKFIIDLVSCNKAALKILEGTSYQDCTFELLSVPTYNESEETEVARMREQKFLAQGRYADCVDELIFKVMGAPLKKLKVQHDCGRV